MRVLAERPRLSGRLHGLAVADLGDPDAFVQRAAADALGRHPDPANLRPLLDLRHRVPADDTHLLHVVRMALRDQLRPAGAWRHLPAPGWTERDARAVADVATGIPSPEAARYLMHHLQHFAEPRENEVRYVSHVARYGSESLAGQLLGFARGDRVAGLAHRVALFRAILQGSQARGTHLPEDTRAWGVILVRQLLTSDADADVVAGIDLGAALGVDPMRTYLLALARDRGAPQVRRETALSALVAADPRAAIPTLARLVGDTSEPMTFRQRAATLLAATKHPEARAELLQILRSAPEQLALTVAAGLAGTREGGEQLLAAVTAGKASAHLLLDRRVVSGLERANVPDFKGRLARLTRGLPTADSRFRELVERRRAGFAAAHKDSAVGAKVFQKHCAVCHQLANQGAKIGPQLDGIGIRGFDRLFEDIVDPSRNVDQAFRSTTLGLNNGQIVTGLLLREEGLVLVLADSQGKEVRVPKSSVEDRTLSQLSPMPANLIDQIPEADFYHLLAFLLAQQPPKGTASGQPAPAGRH
jgi:putative heme-binding domain-containing protein